MIVVLRVLVTAVQAASTAMEIGSQKVQLHLVLVAAAGRIRRREGV